MTNRLGKIQSSSEQYLLQHRFGDQLEDDEVEDEELVKGRCLYDVQGNLICSSNPFVRKDFASPAKPQVDCFYLKGKWE